MDYCLDVGDGTASIWTGPAGLDLDGDGLLDDLIGDGDGDGMGDYAQLDLDDDGVPEARYTDDGTGTWAVSDTPPPPLRWFGLDGTEHPGAPGAGGGDVDGDGAPEELTDINRDGLADRALSYDHSSGYVDTDGDGRWDLHLVDSDGDGSADGAGGL
ncbi:MAG: pullulanase [Mycobacterium sp.]|nr:pullulanase [Mycobacterium sp.]